MSDSYTGTAKSQRTKTATDISTLSISSGTMSPTTGDIDGGLTIHGEDVLVVTGDTLGKEITYPSGVLDIDGDCDESHSSGGQRACCRGVSLDQLAWWTEAVARPMERPPAYNRVVPTTNEPAPFESRHDVDLWAKYSRPASPPLEFFQVPRPIVETKTSAVGVCVTIGENFPTTECAGDAGCSIQELVNEKRSVVFAAAGA